MNKVKVESPWKLYFDIGRNLGYQLRFVSINELEHSDKYDISEITRSTKCQSYYRACIGVSVEH